jgi:hypothetical protein
LKFYFFILKTITTGNKILLLIMAWKMHFSIFEYKFVFKMVLEESKKLS